MLVCLLPLIATSRYIADGEYAVLSAPCSPREARQDRQTKSSAALLRLQFCLACVQGILLLLRSLSLSCCGQSCRVTGLTYKPCGEMPADIKSLERCKEVWLAAILGYSLILQAIGPSAM